MPAPATTGSPLETPLADAAGPTAKAKAKAMEPPTPPTKQQELLDVYGVTADCLLCCPCWFRVCCDKCIAKHRSCSCKIGRYCGTYVVVERGIGQEMLTRLTLVILDFAQYEGLEFKPPTAQQVARLDVAKQILEVQKDIRTKEKKQSELSSQASRSKKPPLPGHYWTSRPSNSPQT